MRLHSPILTPLGIGLLVLCRVSASLAQGGTTSGDWRREWAVAEGLGLSLDTEGYHFPTAIAFVPEPGRGPKEPLYFVTELRGKVKVVTNDRSVYTFAQDFIRSRPLEELPEFGGETGLAGICLAPEHGYVFVTFAYREAREGPDTAAGSRPRMASGRATVARRAGGALRNNVIRFQSTPQTFSLQATGQRSFTRVFAGYEAAISHQIGACQVAGDRLYVSVADGWQTAQSQQVNTVLGKVLRMTLDGRPAPGNPFYRPDDNQQAADFVWAYGLRNPFGLKLVGDRLFAADNGLEVDRFVEVRRGVNYLWDGSDWSIGARADLTLFPDVGPAQTEYYPGEGGQLPREYEESFFVAASSPERPGVLHIGYGLREGRVRGTPKYLLRYRGGGTQLVTGLALGPDGLYVVPALPDSGGRSVVLKVASGHDAPHPYVLTHTEEPEALMEEKGCFGCHELNGAGQDVGPALDPGPLADRLEARLHSKAYTEALAEVDRLEGEPFRRFREARAELARASGREKLRTWMIYRLMEPKFDNPDAQMPSLGLSRAEAALIADHLLQERPVSERWRDALLGLLPAPMRPDPLMYRHLLVAFVGGLAFGALLLALWPRVKAVVRRRRRGRAGSAGA